MSDSDPLGYLTPTDQVIKIANTAREDLNGQVAKVISFNTERKRYNISLASLSPQVLSLKPENLLKGGMMDKMKYRAQEARVQANQMMNDPYLRQQYQQAYNNVQRRLPPGVKVEYLPWIILFFFLCSVRFFGLSKTVLALSFLLMPILICAPDIMSGMPFKTIIKNFPLRWKTAIAEMTGYQRLSDRAAIGIFIAFALLCLRVLWMPSSSNMSVMNVAAGQEKGASLGDYPMSSTHASSFPQKRIEDIYKLGFNDAFEGKEYGHSMPTQQETFPENKLNEQDDFLDYQQPLRTHRSNTMNNKIGFGTMMAVFHLGRTFKNLGTGPDGRMNAQLLILNLKNLNPMNMGFIGLSVYKILRIFF